MRESTRFFLPLTDFLLKIKDLANRGRQICKGPVTGGEGHKMPSQSL